MSPVKFLAALAALTGGCSKDERFIFCGFAGDPNADRAGKWRPIPWRPGDPVPINPRNTNGYLAVSTFGRNERGQYRRIQEQFASGRLMMVDDVGDGAATNKVARSQVKHVPPTAIIETSPGNEQWLYFFAEPVRSRDYMDGLITAFIEQKLLDGRDPGMRGVNRVFRLPGFLNGKKQYRTRRRPAGWRCRLTHWAPERLYEADELKSAFGLVIRRAARRAPTPPPEKVARQAAFYEYVRALHFAGMLKRNRANLAGWTDIICPWTDEHTARANTGAGIRHPAPENEWYGAFQCHHGHCADRTWADLTEWIALAAAEELEQANEQHQRNREERDED